VLQLEDKNCCGFNTDNARVTLLGALTFAYPAFVVSAISVPLLLPWHGAAERAASLASSLLTLINARLTVGFRRAAASRLYRLSPAAAGVFYKYLNVVLLTALWAGGLWLLTSVL
jgi:hypothetical protein